MKNLKTNIVAESSLESLQKTRPKSDIFHGFWSVFLMKFETFEPSLWNAFHLDTVAHSKNSRILSHRRSKSNFSSNFEEVPKSIKNVRFGSVFLHVIRKSIPQQERSNFEFCREDILIMCHTNKEEGKLCNICGSHL